MNVEKIARQFYDNYCLAVGGLAFNGDPLPKSEEFFEDPSKKLQADAWRGVAQNSITNAELEYGESEQAIRLGETYLDQVHGVKGKATAVCVFLTGPSRVCLEWVDDQGAVQEHWLDQERVTRLTE